MLVLSMVAETEAGAVEDRGSLQELASDLAGIAARASAIADRHGRPPDRGDFTSAQVRALLDARHKRSAALGLDVVNPGWSLLLVLLCAHLEGRPVRMARLATDAHVAITTMARWMELFLARGLVERRRDPTHARGVLCALSAKGAEQVRQQLEAEVEARQAWRRGQSQ